MGSHPSVQLQGHSDSGPSNNSLSNKKWLGKGKCFWSHKACCPNPDSVCTVQKSQIKTTHGRQGNKPTIVVWSLGQMPQMMTDSTAPEGDTENQRLWSALWVLSWAPQCSLQLMSLAGPEGDAAATSLWRSIEAWRSRSLWGLQRSIKVWWIPVVHHSLSPLIRGWEQNSFECELMKTSSSKADRRMNPSSLFGAREQDASSKMLQ